MAEDELHARKRSAEPPDICEILRVGAGHRLHHVERNGQPKRLGRPAVLVCEILVDVGVLCVAHPLGKEVVALQPDKAKLTHPALNIAEGRLRRDAHRASEEGTLR